VILLFALAAGLLIGLAGARSRGYPYQAPDLRYFWLAFAAFLPQFIVIYSPLTRENLPEWVVAVFLLTSQVMLFGFAWFNRRIPGMAILICGVVLNLVVMTANSGFMPISPLTASRWGQKTFFFIQKKPASSGWRTDSSHQAGFRIKWHSASAIS